jgi:hypothetical protein
MGAEEQLGKVKGKLFGREIVWRRPSWMRREYVMLVDDEPSASLAFTQWFSREAVAQGMGTHFKFNRKGFFRLATTAENVDVQEETAPFRYAWHGGGKLTLDDGETLTYRHATWRNASHWETSAGQRLITFAHVYTWASWWRFDVRVTLEAAAADYPELPFLILMGFYLRVLYEEDTSAAAVSVSS